MSAAEIAAVLRERQTFILTSHARPDGDAIGSQMALGVRAAGARQAGAPRQPRPGAGAPTATFPGVDDIEIASRVDGAADAVVTLECSDLTRPGLDGLEPYFVINVDHHLGNAMYGDANWFDGGAAACAEMVADIIDALGVPGRRRSRRTCIWASRPTPAASATARLPRARSRSAAGSR